jgi:lipopolysaccharide export system protein LptA
MSRPLFIISSLIILFFTSTIAFSEEKAQRIKGPIVITSETLTVDNEAHTALFENSVVARTTDTTLYADKMLVYYKADTGDIIKIEASENIKLIKGARAIISKEATYYADGEKIIFTGDPRAVEGENVVTGKKITYFLNDDRFFVEDSKVFLKKRGGQ